MLLRPLNLPAHLAGPMRELGPYAAVALIVPGGSLIALSLWAFRHRAWLTACVKRAAESTPHRPYPSALNATPKLSDTVCHCSVRAGGIRDAGVRMITPGTQY